MDVDGETAWNDEKHFRGIVVFATRLEKTTDLEVATVS